MSFDQERSGEAVPDAARDDSPTTPATPTVDAADAGPAAAVSFSKQPAAPESAPAAEAADAGSADAVAVGPAADAPAAISFSKQSDAPEPAPVDAPAVAATSVDAPPAPAAEAADAGSADAVAVGPAVDAPVAISFSKQSDEPEPASVDAPAVAATPVDAPPAPGAPPAPANPWAPPVAPPPAPGVAPAGAPVPPGANPWGAAQPDATAGGNPWAPTGVQQPWGAGGYPPPGVPGAPTGPMVMYPQQQRSLYTNNLAIASLITGIVCCYFGFIGIGLGIGALRQIKRTGERGKGLAISGIVTGSLGMVLFVLSVIGGTFSVQDFEDDSSTPSHVTSTSNAATPDSPFRLRVGQCFNRAMTGFAKPVDCTSSHHGEVYWTQPTSKQDGKYPGEDALKAEADEVCPAHVDTYVADTWTIPDSVSTFYYFPDRLGWNTSGSRRIVCFLGNEDKSSRTGSLQKYPSTLTTDQRQLLDATNQFDRAWINGPDEDSEVEDDPQAFRTWAKDMSVAATKQATMLKAAHWNTADKATVDRLIAKSMTASDHYLAAYRSTDNATLRRELGVAEDNLGDEEIISLRRALGLATAQEEPSKKGSQPV
ncbi:DUF4190 domain-containing protein [Kitasatospora sp. NPDC051984]|uniref:DUF4190 domain-containing protein n=1 Tax=Kitasatospora sp. NPDC051984 TaxID=3364059 RepID=UPI0037C899E9